MRKLIILLLISVVIISGCSKKEEEAPPDPVVVQPGMYVDPTDNHLPREYLRLRLPEVNPEYAQAAGPREWPEDARSIKSTKIETEDQTYTNKEKGFQFTFPDGFHLENTDMRFSQSELAEAARTFPDVEEMQKFLQVGEFLGLQNEADDSVSGMIFFKDPGFNMRDLTYNVLESSLKKMTEATDVSGASSEDTSNTLKRNTDVIDKVGYTIYPLDETNGAMIFANPLGKVWIWFNTDGTPESEQIVSGIIKSFREVE